MNDIIETTGIVVCDGETVSIKTVSMTNRCGGTSFLPAGRYLVELIGGFHDYETGTVRHGRLLREEDIDVARVVGTCQYDSEYWRKRAEKSQSQVDCEHYHRVLEAERNFDPSKVHFHVWSEENQNWFPGETE